MFLIGSTNPPRLICNRLCVELSQNNQQYWGSIVMYLMLLHGFSTLIFLSLNHLTLYFGHFYILSCVVRKNILLQVDDDYKSTLCCFHKLSDCHWKIVLQKRCLDPFWSISLHKRFWNAKCRAWYSWVDLFRVLTKNIKYRWHDIIQSHDLNAFYRCHDITSVKLPGWSFISRYVYFRIVILKRVW